MKVITDLEAGVGGEPFGRNTYGSEPFEIYHTQH